MTRWIAHFIPTPLDLFRASDGYSGDDGHIILHSVHFIEEKRACVTAKYDVALDPDLLVILIGLACRWLVLELRLAEWLQFVVSHGACPPDAAESCRRSAFFRPCCGWRQVQLPQVYLVSEL